MRDLQAELASTKVKRAVDLAKSVHDLPSEVRVEIFATYCSLFLGDPEAARMHAHRRLQAAEQLQNRFRLFMSLHTNLAMCLREGSWQDGRAFAKRGLSLSSSPSFTMISIDWAILEYQVGDFDKGAELVERSIDGLRLSKPGAGYRYALVAAGIPVTAMISGDTSRLDRAQEVAEIVESDDNSALFIQVTARMGLGLIAVLRGDKAAASELYTALLPMSGRFSTWQMTSDRLLGLLARTMNQYDTSIDHFQKALEDCRATHHRPEFAWVCCDYTDVLLERNQSGDRDMAKSLLDEGLAVAHELGMRPLHERIASRMEQQQSE
jgi:tetratricopeptide (TPR) repeat protein